MFNRTRNDRNFLAPSLDSIHLEERYEIDTTPSKPSERWENIRYHLILQTEKHVYTGACSVVFVPQHIYLYSFDLSRSSEKRAISTRYSTYIVLMICLGTSSICHLKRRVLRCFLMNSALKHTKNTNLSRNSSFLLGYRARAKTDH